MPNLEWTKISEESYRAGFRKMLRQTYRMPDGSEEVYDIKNEGVVVCIVPLTAEGKVVMAKQFRPGPGKIMLELPGGGVEQNEDPIDAATRELLEETGYRGQLTHLGSSHDDGYSSQVRHHFLATNCQKVQEPQPDHTEFIEVEEVSVDQLKELVQQGGLTDSNTALRGLWHSGLL